MTPSDHFATGAISTGVIFIGIMAAVAGALYGSLKERAAALMQPKAPKAGKRIFLEVITPLWKRMRFTHKVTARNLIRYKKRFFMTVVGIFGCTALLLTGFGLRDSISDIIDIQFTQLFDYNLTVGLKHGGDDQTDRRIRQVLEDASAVYGYMQVSQETATLRGGGGSVEVTAVVPKSAADMAGYVNFRDRESGRAVPFGEDSVLLSEKAARILGVTEGGAVELENADKETASFTVTGIIENYVQSYIYIAPGLFNAAYAEEAEYTTLLAKAEDKDAEIRDSTSSRLLVSPNVTSVQFTNGLISTFTDMLSTIDYIVVVLILCAGVLAFVVMYNLTNINITERQKELATIKVLGFYRREVNMYIFRETTILSIVGAAVGLGGGIFLHRFVVTTAEVDNMMFGRIIYPLSYVLSFVITIAFSLIVNFVMSFKMKKISMAESLKAPE
jgi:putative ABC transport system permease protein